MAKHRSNQGYLSALVLAAACWGFGAVMTKYALDQAPPLTLLVVQLVVSVVLLWIAVVVQGIPVRASRDSVRLGLIGVLNPGLAYTFSLLGLAQSTASCRCESRMRITSVLVGAMLLVVCALVVSISQAHSSAPPAISASVARAVNHLDQAFGDHGVASITSYGNPNYYKSAGF